MPASDPVGVVRPSHTWAALGGVVALGAAMSWLWGFTVDDALITCRVASHLASGVGYRFNVGGPVVDAVTPLGFAYVLVPFAGSGPLAALLAAKWLGALSVLGATFAVGRRVVRRAGVVYGSALLGVLALNAPLSAWAVSGMETGLVTALAMLALASSPAGDVAAALAAALRPELLPWAMSVRLGLRLAAGVPLQRAALSPLGVLSAVAVVGLTRAVCFGRVAPLSVFAKPSDLSHGISYAVFAFVQTGLPLLSLAPMSLRRASPVARALGVAAVAHFAALALAGGDWMSLYRLAVPVLPSLALLAAELWHAAPRWASWGRLVAAGAMSVYLAVMVGPTARGVGPDRERLIAGARAPLAGARHVAALDVGWVGVSTGANIVDLAGVTDETIAMLPGGHTSKRIGDGLLRARDVDALVLLAYPPHDELAREVERRVSMTPTAQAMELVARVPFAGGSQHYLIYRATRR